MPTATRRKIMNVSGQDLVVPWLAGRVVEVGEVVLVAEQDVPAYLCQPGVWEAGDADTEQTYAEVIAQAEQEAATAAAAAAPPPFDPGPVPLGLEFVVPLTEQSQEYLTHAEPVEQPTPAAPQRTADAPTPQPVERPVERPVEPPVEPPVAQASVSTAAQPPTSGRYAAYPDLTNTPAEDTVTGMLAAVRARPTL